MGERIILRSVWSFSVPFKLCKLLLGGDEFWICGGLGSPRGASHERSSSDAINGSFTMLFEIVPLRAPPPLSHHEPSEDRSIQLKVYDDPFDPKCSPVLDRDYGGCRPARLG